MTELPSGSIQIGGSVTDSILVTGSDNVISVKVAAAKARAIRQDPAKMLRIAALLASPVLDPDHPGVSPAPLDLRDEWMRLAGAVQGSNAPVLLSRLVPPTLETMRSALSPRMVEQSLFPHVLHFSGHAWKEGLLLEDEWGQTHYVTVKELLESLDLPRPLKLVVLNACESAAEAESVAQSMLKAGLTEAVIGHPKPVLDDDAVAFAWTLYRELADGRTVEKALERANRHISTHGALLVGDKGVRFEGLARGTPVVDDARPPGEIPSRPGLGFFFGRGKELVQIARGLGRRRSFAPVLVITGVEGIGKTTLALEAAHRNAWRYRGGVAYAEGPGKGAAGTADGLIATLASALKLQGEKSAAGLLLEHTRTASTLLLLDNLENLPATEIERLVEVLKGLGEGSAAILTLRLPVRALEEMPQSVRVPLHEGLAPDDAVRYALKMAQSKNLPLEWHQAARIAEAVRGHPKLLELLVAQAGHRDLGALLGELESKSGDFEALLERVLEWSAERVGEDGRRAWQALQSFPAGLAPEALLLAAVEDDGKAAANALDSLRGAALADFDPGAQAWRWHAIVAEYAAVHWPLAEEERQQKTETLVPAWTRWLERLNKADAPRFVGLQRANLEVALDVCERMDREAALDFLKTLSDRLPDPDHTLALRDFDARVYEVLAKLAPDADTRAGALNNLGAALSALGLREEALAATEEAVEKYRQLARKAPDVFRPRLAMSLNNLGIALFAVGQRDEALAVAKEAVEIRRELTQRNPDAYLPDLAMSLNNLGSILSILGQREEALEATKEAVDILQDLSLKSPDVFPPELATSLYNLGKILSDLGRREEALAATEGAVEIRRKLARKNPDAFLPDLAGSLDNLGTMLSNLGRRDEALAATKEAVGFYREFAKKNRRAFLPDLAGSLDNLSARLSDLGQWEEALAATKEAVGFYRELVGKSPDAFMPELALNLVNLGRALSNLGRQKEALAATKEAVEIQRELAQKNPDAFLSDLALSINNLGEILSALGRHEKALASAEEAVEKYRQLVRKNPDAFLPDLAMSLNNLSKMLSALGRHEKALEATEEAVKKCRQLALKSPDAFLPYLAMSLVNLGRALSDIGKHDGALEATEEAVEKYRQLVRKNPGVFLPNLALGLNNLGKMLSDLGRREEALEATEEVVEIRRELARKNPDVFLPDLAMSLNNLGLMLSALGRREEALAAMKEAVEKYRQLARKNRDAFLPNLAMSLNNLGGMLSALGRRKEALAAIEEAVEIRRELTQKKSDAFLPDLAASLNNLGNALSALGRWEKALAATEEAVEKYRQLARKNLDAFLPYLAMSLGAHGYVLEGMDKYEGAAESFAEGLRAILPFVKALPQAFRGLAGALLQDYVNAAQAAGVEPDEELVRSVREVIG